MEQALLLKNAETPWLWAAHLPAYETLDALPATVSLCWLDECHTQWSELAVRLKAQGIETVLVSSELNLTQMQQAFALGVRGYCDTKISSQTSTTIAVTVTHNGLWVPNHLLAKVVGNLATLPQYHRQSPVTEATETLTGREKMVTNLILEGCNNLQISEQLSITERTVKQHISAILKKFAARDRVGLLLKLGQFRKLA